MERPGVKSTEVGVVPVRDITSVGLLCTSFGSFTHLQSDTCFDKKHRHLKKILHTEGHHTITYIRSLFAECVTLVLYYFSYVGLLFDIKGLCDLISWTSIEGGWCAIS